MQQGNTAASWHHQRPPAADATHSASVFPSQPPSVSNQLPSTHSTGPTHTTSEQACSYSNNASHERMPCMGQQLRPGISGGNEERAQASFSNPFMQQQHPQAQQQQPRHHNSAVQPPQPPGPYIGQATGQHASVGNSQSLHARCDVTSECSHPPNASQSQQRASPVKPAPEAAAAAAVACASNESHLDLCGSATVPAAATTCPPPQAARCADGAGAFTGSMQQCGGAHLRFSGGFSAHQLPPAANCAPAAAAAAAVAKPAIQQLIHSASASGQHIHPQLPPPQQQLANSASFNNAAAMQPNAAANPQHASARYPQAQRHHPPLSGQGSWPHPYQHNAHHSSGMPSDTPQPLHHPPSVVSKPAAGQGQPSCQPPAVPPSAASVGNSNASNSMPPKPPACPYDACPGVYTFCGAQLLWVNRFGMPFWGCSNYQECDFRQVDTFVSESEICWR